MLDGVVQGMHSADCPRNRQADRAGGPAARTNTSTLGNWPRTPHPQEWDGKLVFPAPFHSGMFSPLWNIPPHRQAHATANADQVAA
jgi:hypothetical protein